jgi:arabinogalactan oligomer/maltooligosaccharide transport system substrate-binding protein
MTRTRRTVAAMLGLTQIVAACSSDGGASTAPSAAESAAAPSADASTAPSAAASGATGDADLVIWADDKRAAALEPLAAQFGEDNGVTVQVEAISADIIPNFLTASEAGTAPDIVVWAHDVVGQLVANSAIDPVQMSDTSGFDPLAVQGMTFDGQLYGIPYSVENIGLFINTDLVEACPATMEELVSTGEALVADGSTTEILALQSGQSGDAYHIYPLFSSGGGSFFELTPEGDPDPTKVSVDSAGSIEAGELLGSIGETGSGALKTSIDNTNAIPLFFDKKAPFLVSGPWAVADIKKAAVNYDIYPIPPWEGKAPAGPFIGVNGFYLASKGANKALAQEFATNFLTTPEVQVAFFEAEPRRPALLEALDQVKATDPDIEKFQAASQGGTILPAIPEMGQVWGPFGVAEAAIIKGEDPAATLQAAAKAIRDGIAAQ